ncbi:MAG: hypothetical protein JXR97_05505 [Planctomycetes bacterium]|nr:hypothetical protein [Planctomycetota bacterium]
MLKDDLFDALCEIPVIDVHSHINRERLCAKGAGDILFYHMLQYPLRSAGIEAEKLWPEEQKFHGAGQPFEDLDKAWPYVEGGGFGVIVKKIFEDLYGYKGEISSASYPEIDEMVKAKSAQEGRAAEVLEKANIKAIYSSVRKPAPEDNPTPIPVIDTYERGVNGRNNESFGLEMFLSKFGEHYETDICCIESLREAIRAHFARHDLTGIDVYVSWKSSQVSWERASDIELDRIIKKSKSGSAVTAEEERVLNGELVWSSLEHVRDQIKIFQMCYGTQFTTRTPAGAIQRACPQYASGMSRLIAEFPDIHFNIMNGFEADEPEWCSLCTAYPNVSLAGFWWMMFYPSVMHNAWNRRFDMVPTSRLMGYFSDGYCVDWVYGRALMTKMVLANVFAERIERGYLDLETALNMAKDVLYNTPKEIFGC